MPVFQFRAIDDRGLLVEGMETAGSRAAALAAIEARALLPTSIENARTGDAPQSAGRGSSSAEQITIFTEDLATLIESGVPLDGALATLETGATVSWVRDLRSAIAGGRSFAEALAEQPGRFAESYFRMVEAAELSGTLGATLRSVARERRRAEALRRRISAALAYPAFLMVAAVGVLVFVLLFVVPQFERAIASSGLPADHGAGFVFKLSAAVRTPGVLPAGAVVLAALLAILWLGRGRDGWRTVMAHVPFVSRLLEYERTVTLSAMMATLLSSGVAITVSLRQAAESMRERGARSRMHEVAADVRQGMKLCAALAPSGLVPAYALQILRVGEESGDLARAFDRVASVYELRLDRGLARAMAVVAPAILLTVSALIAWVIISVVTALLSFNELAL